MYFRWWVLFSSIQFNFKMHFLWRSPLTQYLLDICQHHSDWPPALRTVGFFVRYFTETFRFENNFKLNHHHMSLYTCIYFGLLLFFLLCYFYNLGGVLFFVGCQLFRLVSWQLARGNQICYAAADFFPENIAFFSCCQFLFIFTKI